MFELHAAVEVPVPNVLSTAEVPERDRFSFWLNGVSSTFVPVRCVPTGDTPVVRGMSGLPAFDGQLCSAAVGSVQATEVRISPHLVERGVKEIRRSDGDYYKLSLQLGGSCLVSQGERQSILRPGDLVLYDTVRPYSLLLGPDYRGLVVLIPRHHIRMPSQRLEPVLSTAIPGDHHLASLLACALTTMAEHLDAVSVQSPWLGDHTIGLVNWLLQQRTGCLTSGKTQPIAHTLQALQLHVREHLSDPQLCPESVARAFHISVRQLHTIFEGSPVTFGKFMRQQRLERCGCVHGSGVSGVGQVR